MAIAQAASEAGRMAGAPLLLPGSSFYLV